MLSLAGILLGLGATACGPVARFSRTLDSTAAPGAGGGDGPGDFGGTVGGRLDGSGGAPPSDGGGSGGRLAVDGSGGAAASGGAPGGSGGTGAGGMPGDSGGAGGVIPGSGGGAGSVGAGILSIDFVGGSPVGPPGSTAMAAAEIAGVRPAAHWNSATSNRGQLAAVALASGAMVPTTVSWGSTSPDPMQPNRYRVAFADAPGDARMMNGYLDPLSTDAPATVTVTDLPASAVENGYDVYVYGTGNMTTAETRLYNYTIGMTTLSLQQTGPSAAAFAGFTLAVNAGAGNYVVFRKLTVPTFTLTARPRAAIANNPQRAPLNGLQIVWPAAP